MSRATLAKDPSEVAGMFDAVARRYDLTNDVMSLWQVRMWRAVTRASAGGKEARGRPARRRRQARDQGP